jgi:hypothetical protein
MHGNGNVWQCKEGQNVVLKANDWHESPKHHVWGKRRPALKYYGEPAIILTAYGFK